MNIYNTCFTQFHLPCAQVLDSRGVGEACEGAASAVSAVAAAQSRTRGTILRQRACGEKGRDRSDARGRIYIYINIWVGVNRYR